MTRSCCFISGLSAIMAFAPPGPKSLARVVNRCMSNKTRSFMVKQGRADGYRVQDLSIVCFYERSNNSPPTGSAVEVQAAMADFISKYQNDLLVHAPYVPTQQTEYRAWLKKFAHWLFETDHISIRYEIVYDGVDIRKLSPGTRGIVLLLLYLALDESDDRPLIIDQPEENLDPRSVFEELVSLFIAAKAKRQVIIVTHNANLVINTDADQIIGELSATPLDLKTIT